MCDLDARCEILGALLNICALLLQSFVQLRVSDQHGGEVHFKIRRKCPIGVSLSPLFAEQPRDIFFSSSCLAMFERRRFRTFQHTISCVN